MAELRRGDLLPRVITPVPGRFGRRLARQLARWEAPGVNTLDPAGSTLVWQEARGCNVLDVDGNRYIDLTAGFGVAAVGHRHPRVVAEIRRQAGELLHGLGDVHAHPARARLARRLAALAPVEQPQVYFAVSGSDAVEVAVKTALLATARPGVLAFDPAYHGLSFGALQLTSRSHFRRPFRAHFHRHVRRLPFACPLRRVESFLGDRSDTACVLVEPIVGREGILLPPDGWLRGLFEICERHGALLIADEVFTGLGRTGRWFAVDRDSTRPHLLCVGKALGGGLPLAAVIGRRGLMAAWSGPGEAIHTATFVAHPLACATALVVLDVLREERLPERAARLGGVVQRRTRDWPSRFPALRAVRGRGLAWGLELDRAAAVQGWVEALRRRGVIALAGGSDGCVLQLTPPLTISDAQLDFGLTAIEETLAAG